MRTSLKENSMGNVFFEEGCSIKIIGFKELRIAEENHCGIAFELDFSQFCDSLEKLNTF